MSEWDPARTKTLPRRADRVFVARVTREMQLSATVENVDPSRGVLAYSRAVILRESDMTQEEASQWKESGLPLIGSLSRYGFGRRYREIEILDWHDLGEFALCRCADWREGPVAVQGDGTSVIGFNSYVGFTSGREARSYGWNTRSGVTVLSKRESLDGNLIGYKIPVIIGPGDSHSINLSQFTYTNPPGYVELSIRLGITASSDPFKLTLGGSFDKMDKESDNSFKLEMYATDVLQEHKGSLLFSHDMPNTSYACGSTTYTNHEVQIFREVCVNAVAPFILVVSNLSPSNYIAVRYEIGTNTR